MAFKSDRLETTVGKPDERSIELDGSVQATFEERNLRLVGHHLSFTETKGAAGPARSGELTGSNAVIEFLENGVSARSIRSPRITFDNDRIDAAGPVDVKIPASSLTGASPPGKGG